MNMNDTAKRLVVIDAANSVTRGAWFDPAQRTAVIKAFSGTAALILEVDTTVLDQVDAEFPAGKLAGAVRPILPVIPRTAYERLATLAAHGTAVVSAPDPMAGIGPGSVVLASVDIDDGWWEAVVVQVEHNGATLRLRWRDFPEYDEFIKPLTRVALPPAGGVR